MQAEADHCTVRLQKSKDLREKRHNERKELCKQAPRHACWTELKETCVQMPQQEGKTNYSRV